MDDSNRTVSVSEAAAALGISTDAVRKRLDRGTLQGEKVSGRWAVTLPDDVLDTATPPTGNQPDASGHHPVDDLRSVIEDLRARLDNSEARVDTLITDLRQERERADTLQALNIQHRDRIRELEALTATVDNNEATESTETGDSDATGINTHAETERAPQSRWARFLALFVPGK